MKKTHPAVFRFMNALLLLAAFLLLVSGAAAEADFEPFFRFDSGLNAWQEPLENVRFLTRGAYTLKPLEADLVEKYNLDPDYMPNTKGMDTLNISGSAEFSEDHFRELANRLRELADGKEIYVIDCRIEGHALLNGISVSWYGDRNWAYKGMTLEEAEADERERFGALEGSVVTVYEVSSNVRGSSADIDVRSVMSERELVESEGFHYLRLSCQDHSWPDEEAVDQFISFVQTLDTDQVWLHFHCHAGKSRTAIFMAIYDMIKNPDVAFEDIMLRHAMTGSNYLPYADPESDIADVYAKRAKRIRQVYDYLQEMGGNYTMTWSEWLGKQTEETRICVFETSDIHGSMMDSSSGKEETFQYRLAYIAHVVNEARASSEYDGVLLLDGGDIYQGTPPSNLTYGAAIRAALDAMDYDAVALGNHEFDWDVTSYAADQDATIPAYRIGDYDGDPDIPVLASGLYYAGTQERVPFTSDYVVIEKAGFRIAVIGYITDYSMSIMTSKIAPYTIDGDIGRFAERVKEINVKEQPDVTIVLAHALASDVAEALDPDEVDLVAGGHKHSGIYGVAASGVPYIQADMSAQGYASAVIIIGADGAVRVEGLSYMPITENKEALYETPDTIGHLDSTILAISHAAWDAVKGEMSEVLGYIDTPIEKKGYTGDNDSTTGGNWITGLMLRATRDQGTVAAFYNTGGIRTSFTIPEGETIREITVGDLYTIAPFCNYLFVYELTGAELRQQLLNGFVSRNYGDQMSGLTFEYINHGTEDEKDIEIVSITLSDGTEVDMEDTETLYRVCTTNYSGTLPGSVFETKEPVVPASEAPIDNETFIEILRMEAEENDGYISVDTSGRGYEIDEEEVLPGDAA